MRRGERREKREGDSREMTRRLTFRFSIFLAGVNRQRIRKLSMLVPKVRRHTIF